MADCGRYLYGIINTDKEEEHFGKIGIDDNPVYTIPFENIAAVVSDIKCQKIRPERKNLASHNGVIRKIVNDRTVLPMAFGHISSNGARIREFLSENYENFLRQLSTLDGKVEMDIKVLWDVENVFEFFVCNHRELKMLRDEIYCKPYGPTNEEKIALGRMFDELLNHERETHTKTVTDILVNYCNEINKNKPKNEKMVMNLAFLVDKNGVERFEKGIYEAAGKFDNNYSFDYNGPWAPHNFVRMIL